MFVGQSFKTGLAIKGKKECIRESECHNMKKKEWKHDLISLSIRSVRRLHSNML